MATHRTRSAARAEASAPGTQPAPDARDGFVTYDELKGPNLDTERWSPARLPLPGGGDHIPLDPNAELAVGDGEARVTIPRFSLSHDTRQPVDSTKYFMVSARRFELPPDRGPRSPSTSRSRTSVGKRGTSVRDWPPSRSSTST